MGRSLSCVSDPLCSLRWLMGAQALPGWWNVTSGITDEPSVPFLFPCSHRQKWACPRACAQRRAGDSGLGEESGDLDLNPLTRSWVCRPHSAPLPLASPVRRAGARGAQAHLGTGSGVQAWPWSCGSVEGGGGAARGDGEVCESRLLADWTHRTEHFSDTWSFLNKAKYLQKRLENGRFF